MSPPQRWLLIKSATVPNEGLLCNYPLPAPLVPLSLLRETHDRPPGDVTVAIADEALRPSQGGGGAQSHTCALLVLQYKNHCRLWLERGRLHNTASLARPAPPPKGSRPSHIHRRARDRLRPKLQPPDLLWSTWQTTDCLRTYPCGDRHSFYRVDVRGTPKESTPLTRLHHRGSHSQPS